MKHRQQYFCLGAFVISGMDCQSEGEQICNLPNHFQSTVLHNQKDELLSHTMLCVGMGLGIVKRRKACSPPIILAKPLSHCWEERGLMWHAFFLRPSWLEGEKKLLAIEFRLRFCMNAYHCCHLDGAAVCQSTDVYSPFLYTHTHTQAHTTHTNTQKSFPQSLVYLLKGCRGGVGVGGSVQISHHPAFS